MRQSSRSGGAGRGARRPRTAPRAPGGEHDEADGHGGANEPDGTDGTDGTDGADRGAARKAPADPAARARNVCLHLLESKARSRAELEQALVKREIPDDVIAAVLDRFAEVGLVDDAALAESMAGAQHRERGLARRAVAAKLRQRGFDDEVVDAALTGIDSDSERARAQQLVTRRLRSLRGLAVEVQTRRLIGLLARKGYPSAMVYDVVREAIRAAAELDTDGGTDIGFVDAGADDFHDVSI